MGNASSSDESARRSLILLDDNFLHNFQKRDEYAEEEKIDHVTAVHSNVEHNNSLGTPIGNAVRIFSSSQISLHNRLADNKKGQSHDILFFFDYPFVESAYNTLRKKVIDDLIRESEIYINSQKDTLYNVKENTLKFSTTNNECFYDENKIYKCLKNMNESTSGFVNSYTRCCRYLRKYESCVQKIKI
ncbi:conserved Plasmodium protein, unknown function [Plasmodium ovale curtisi]|uniref:Uncharacterized protein n=1 Tax=Plasmodium ovale curtisi TaxID=864141 RepID=A0A1A8X8I3_PLAOA|nr:conserved Plasmodium protein, unknown function [Plasmodium ovale curtisi]SBT00575.1 conserved Plasmodium protein, unknown function [Plasmodium ovale curtisi]